MTLMYPDLSPPDLYSMTLGSNIPQTHDAYTAPYFLIPIRRVPRRINGSHIDINMVWWDLASTYLGPARPLVATGRPPSRMIADEALSSEVHQGLICKAAERTYPHRQVMLDFGAAILLLFEEMRKRCHKEIAAIAPLLIHSFVLITLLRTQ
ncbi:hypothetical protein BC834DRAFT_858106 [Gloeopeniophorella convolvens]|nr:hypothetical protein BC834DRAFT_858106 [Gloeopeniophorella convolvens]